MKNTDQQDLEDALSRGVEEYIESGERILSIEIQSLEWVDGWRQTIEEFCKAKGLRFSISHYQTHAEIQGWMD